MSGVKRRWSKAERVLGAGLLVLVTMAVGARAQIYSAASGLLPTETCVPWQRTLDGGSPPPSVSGSALVLSTSSCPQRLSHALLEPAISLPPVVWIEARLRIISGGTCTPVRRTVTLAITTDPGVGQSVHIGPGELITTASNGPGTDYVSGQHPLDTSVYHTYRVTVDATGATQVAVDGVPVIFTSVSVNTSNHGLVRRIGWGHGSLFSFGTAEWDYVDSNVIQELGVDLRQPVAGGPFTVCNRGMIPGHEYVNLFNIELCPGGPNSGPLLGLCATNPLAIQILVSQYTQPVGTPPFRFIAPGTHAQWGPFPSLPLTLDVICLDLTGGVLVANTPVTRQSIL